MDSVFTSTEPYDDEMAWCGSCLENTVRVRGIAVDKWGVYAATRCTKCGDIYVGPESNPFEEINRKLDKLMSWAGLG